MNIFEHISQNVKLALVWLGVLSFYALLIITFHGQCINACIEHTGYNYPAENSLRE